ncbi:MAG: hypothetical protein GF398_03505 [Chitinivibrionales bacterium]|nr:hypothetical protein [Chitinivibrionales bacterium]
MEELRLYRELHIDEFGNFRLLFEGKDVYLYVWFCENLNFHSFQFVMDDQFLIKVNRHNLRSHGVIGRFPFNRSVISLKHQGFEKKCYDRFYATTNTTFSTFFLCLKSFVKYGGDVPVFNFKEKRLLKSLQGFARDKAYKVTTVAMPAVQ